MDERLARLDLPGRWADQPPERFVGAALNAWLYGELARRWEALAERLHGEPSVKPFALALLPDRLVVAGYGPLYRLVAALAERPPERLLLDARWWETTGTPTCYEATWGELAAPLLTGRPATVRLAFLSPTTFHTRGAYRPLPDPDPLFRGLLVRWQRFGAVDLGDGAAAALGAIALRRYEARSVAVQLAGLVPAFLGWAEFVARRPEPAYAGLAAALGGFAPFAGVGHKVGMGLGCVAPPRRPARSTEEEER
ncbi:MAG TPA: CRISPR system precrRNA processing endoribonuclease RAMP protein Cas6 [Chloroflexota bacterium]|nr:CRISPR system precrRNA processing endoribonuclease RAMP protein Cas6 [Chloroflexota bacterium]